MDLKRIYEIVIKEWGDPRAEPFVLVNTPLALIIIIWCYVYFVFVCGPKFMKNRPSLNIDWIISIYNCIQIIWNGILLYMAFVVIKLGLAENYDWLCIPMYQKNQDLENLFIYGGIWYFYNKLFDLLDTVFFVLRKKSSQASYLHVFHHSAMAIGGWLYVKYHLGGNGFSLIISNVLVHVVMYTYYQLSLMKWNTQKWKKHLTQIQIIQFAIVVSHHAVLFFRNYCQQNLYIALLVVVQGTYMTSLFISFYFSEYIVKKKKKGDKGKISVMETDHSKENVQKLQNGLHKRTPTKQQTRMC